MDNGLVDNVGGLWHISKDIHEDLKLEGILGN